MSIPKSEKVGDVSDKKCYFSTFIDEVTITCSPDGRFDFYGFPIKLCDKLPFCDKIKEMNNEMNTEMNKGLCKENKSRTKK